MSDDRGAVTSSDSTDESESTHGFETIEEIFDRHGWDDLDDVDPHKLANIDMSKVPDEALPTDDRCPKCHYPVFGVTTRGPHAHELTPCGCRVMVPDF